MKKFEDLMNVKNEIENISAEEAKDISRVKLICNFNKEAIFFSRSKIPYGETTYKQHVGIYGFCSESLKIINNLSESYLEKVESLEQLRWIESGLKINVINSNNRSN